MRFLLTLALGLIFALGAQAQTTTRAIRPQTYTRGAMALELNGVMQGMVRAIAGGAMYGEVITDRNGPTRQTSKRTGPVRYEPITVEVGMDMAPQFWDMVRQWPATSKPLNGAVVFADVNFRQLKRMEFTNALITEIGFPALDASEGKNAFTLLVTLQPEKLENRPASGMLSASAAKARPILCNNFRLIADGVDFSRVTKVDAFAIKQKATENPVGVLRRLEAVVGTPEYDDLVITMPETSSSSLEKWFQESVIKGTGKERDVRVEMLDPTLKAVLFTITLRGVGIWKLGGGPQEANVQRVAQAEARFYVEGVTIDIK